MGLDRVREVALRLGVLPPAKQQRRHRRYQRQRFDVGLPRGVVARGWTHGRHDVVAASEPIQRTRAGEWQLLSTTTCCVMRLRRSKRARREITLTYFEFGILAALLVFRRADVDVTVLEVGLGGRLDAVNLVDGIGHGDYEYRHRPCRIPRTGSRIDRRREGRHPASRRAVRVWRSVDSVEHRRSGARARCAAAAPWARFPWRGSERRLGIRRCARWSSLCTCADSCDPAWL